jgi:hypothetical protein
MVKDTEGETTRREYAGSKLRMQDEDYENKTVSNNVNQA